MDYKHYADILSLFVMIVALHSRLHFASFIIASQVFAVFGYCYCVCSVLVFYNCNSPLILHATHRHTIKRLYIHTSWKIMIITTSTIVSQYWKKKIGKNRPNINRTSSHHSHIVFLVWVYVFQGFFIDDGDKKVGTNDYWLARLLSILMTLLAFALSLSLPLLIFHFPLVVITNKIKEANF